MSAPEHVLSARHVSELVAELALLVTGARVVDVQPHPPRDLLLVLETTAGGPVRRLRLSADPEACRIHLQIGRVRRHAGSVGPFYRRVIEALAGRHIARVEQIESDRAVRVVLEEVGGGDRHVSLLAELYGRHANLLLLDGGDAIRARLVEPRPGSRAAERLGVGSTWSPSGGGQRRAPGPDPSLVEAFPEPEPESEGELAELAPLSWRVESALGATAEVRHSAERRRDLLQRIDRRLASARKLVAGLAQRAAACAGAARIRMDAELLTAHLGTLRRGMKRVELPDSHDPDGGTRTIELDPRLSPQKNAASLFRRYKKLERTGAHLPAERERAASAVALLEELRQRAQAPDADLEALAEEAVAGGFLRPRQLPPERRRTEPRRPYHRFRGRAGAEIRVGRNARDNDALTFKNARGNDLWLHTAQAPGSHVVLVIERGREPDDEDVLDAAHLAIHYSPLRGTAKAEIHVARCKEVKKPRGAPAGLVSLSGGRTRMVRVEEGRLRRLLDTRPGGKKRGQQGS